MFDRKFSKKLGKIDKYQLALLGAKVIKIENLDRGAGLLNSSSYRYANRLIFINFMKGIS